MMDQIQELYRALDRKSDFLQVAGRKFKRSPQSIKNHWLNEMAMPLEHQKEFLRFIKKADKLQQSYISKLRSLK